MNTVEKAIINAGVKNLREFGYPTCNESNIFTDPVFAAFFKSMLEENKGKGRDKEINALLERIATSQPSKG